MKSMFLFSLKMMLFPFLSYLIGEMAPFYSKLLLNVFLSSAKDGDEHIRASSLSNLGEICQLLRFSLAGSIHEVSLHLLYCSGQVHTAR